MMTLERMCGCRQPANSGLWYNSSVTAKELLQRKVAEMTEQEAELFLEILFDDDEDFAFPPLTPDELAQIDRAIARTDAGKGIPHSEVLRRFGRV
jgi:hypothetical protein